MNEKDENTLENELRIALIDKVKVEYISLCESERKFIEHNGIYIPKNVYEFLDWYFECYLFGASISEMKEVELNLYHLNLFYKFKQRYKTHKKWDIEKEREFLKDMNKIDALPRVTNKKEEKILASGNLPFQFIDEHERRYRRTVYDVGRELCIKFTVNRENDIWTVNYRK